MSLTLDNLTINLGALIISIFSLALSSISLVYLILIRKGEKQIDKKFEHQEKEDEDRIVSNALSYYKNFIINLTQVRRFQKILNEQKILKQNAQYLPQPGDPFNISPNADWHLDNNLKSSLRMLNTLLKFLEYNLYLYEEKGKETQFLNAKEIIVEQADRIISDNTSEHALFQLENWSGLVIDIFKNYTPKTQKHKQNLLALLDFYNNHTKFVLENIFTPVDKIIHTKY